ncbi:2-keto-4-pentenoate hydratase/2-oxohepta-3-ene-1,7-dioic acid hydratase in catechol pathway [Neobacillus niacini]|uniref:fumarylacetoacetate hydrolase family protein n=1 Tax=Neobacillus niacini TaxID=86668 RepID=UPI002854968F|nr:fumarylacetoacetate hydrolase family protein [Neobacillus niacini]MDR7076159.1 2-keto-4-pentenoate hydratase/2-oxohepta-3-ene-1,7-dioic acid hydratase in catechol pathway [Neobacillus niacini]
MGVIDGQTIIDITDKFPDMLSLIKAGKLGIEEIESVIQSGRGKIPLDHQVLLAPIPKVKRNIICVGWNYLEHFNERYRQDIDLPKKPTIFTKATGTIAGPFEEIPLSEKHTKMFDYEAELALIIGVGGKNIKESDAMNHVFGFMVANDLSARDIQQEHGGQWFMGKSLDKSCPVGPWIVTKEEIKDPQNLDITCTVNGTTVQKSNTSLMIFPIKQIISVLSQGMTLEPGDIILTGTPSGVGFKRNPPILLRKGDEVEINISGIGHIKNRIIDSYES